MWAGCQDHGDGPDWYVGYVTSIRAQGGSICCYVQVDGCANAHSFDRVLPCQEVGREPSDDDDRYDFGRFVAGHDMNRSQRPRPAFQPVGGRRRQEPSGFSSIGGDEHQMYTDALKEHVSRRMAEIERLPTNAMRMNAKMQLAHEMQNMPSSYALQAQAKLRQMNHMDSDDMRSW